MPRDNINNYYISTKKSLLNKEKICELLQQCFWAKNIPLEYINRFIKYSLCFGIYQKKNNHLVGFGRVISDYTTYAYICDVVIDHQYRRLGLASKLIKKILSHPKLQGLQTWSLRTTESSRKIYEKNNFTAIANPDTHLEINKLEVYFMPNFKNIYK